MRCNDANCGNCFDQDRERLLYVTLDKTDDNLMEIIELLESSEYDKSLELANETKVIIDESNLL